MPASKFVFLVRITRWMMLKIPKWLRSVEHWFGVLGRKSTSVSILSSSLSVVYVCLFEWFVKLLSLFVCVNFINRLDGYGFTKHGRWTTNRKMFPMGLCPLVIWEVFWPVGLGRVYFYLFFLLLWICDSVSGILFNALIPNHNKLSVWKIHRRLGLIWSCFCGRLCGCFWLVAFLNFVDIHHVLKSLIIEL